MKKLGKTFIWAGLLLTGIPLLFAILNALYSSNLMDIGLLRGIRYLVANPIPSNIFWRWLVGVVYYSNRVFESTFLINLFLFFAPNVLVICGFIILINPEQKIEIKKSFNVIVLIGIALNIPVLFKFFGLYLPAYRNTFLSPILLGWSNKYGYPVNFIFFILYLFFYIVPVLPTLLISIGYSKFFKKEKTEKNAEGGQ